MLQWVNLVLIDLAWPWPSTLLFRIKINKFGKTYMKCWCILHDHVLLYLSDAYFFSHIIIWFIHISYCEYIVIDRYIFIIHPFQCPCGFVQDWNIYSALTHWGRVTHICVGKLIIIGSDNGLSPERRQAIIWPNAGILLIGPLGTNFSEILIEIQTFSLKKTRWKCRLWNVVHFISASMC